MRKKVTSYMDPPYEKQKGMYFANKFDNNKMYSVMRKVSLNGVYYAMSYDGTSGDTDWTVDVPKDIYVQHRYIKSGHSSFKKLNSAKFGHNKDVVHESLYLNYEPIELKENELW